ncbi:hypothetical protein LIA77_02955 [Sarocladium implicatum]|nr:hypothetical protein LIA77_02955 [Sarocladium implicatum]
MATDGQSEPSPGPEDHALDAAIEAAEAGHATVPQRSPGIFERIRIVLVGQSTEPKYDKVQELLLNRPLSTPNISQPWYIRSLFMHYSIYKKRQALFLGKYEEDSLYSFDMLGQHWIVATALPLQSASSSTSRIASTSHPSSAPTSQRLPLPHSDVGNDYISVNGE